MPTGVGIGISPLLKWISSGSAPVVNNATVQTYLDKATAAGYTLPTAPKITIYNTAWDYADAQGLTTQFDLVGLLKVENQNLCKIPFIHSGGAAKRFTLNGSPVFTANKGLKRASVGAGKLLTSWIQNTNAVKFALGNASFGVNTDYTLLALSALGSVDLGETGIYPKLDPTSALATTQSDSGDIVQVAVPTPAGFSVCTVSSGNLNFYKNGALLGTAPMVGSTVYNTVEEYVINQNGGSDYYPGDIQFFYYGSGSIDQAKLNTFVNLLLL